MLEKPEFFILAPPSSRSLLATWDDDIEMESIACPLVVGHRRAGRRQSSLRVKIPGVFGEMVWTWQRDVLFSQTLVDFVASERLTGLIFREAVVRTANGQTLQQTHYKEAVVTGWGGVARKESGITLEESCPACGYLHYSSLSHPSLLFAEGSWDGSDFFVVWPLPRFLFVSKRVKRLFQHSSIGPCRFLPLQRLKTNRTGFTPGRLSYWMPTERALELGSSGGIA
jgi:hypothetical protein